MKPMEILKTQHRDIINIVDKMNDELAGSTGQNSATILLERIAELATLLEEHLLIEDTYLYPVLKKRQSEEIRTTATRFASELGGIKDAFAVYFAKWKSPEDIMQSNQEFLSDSKSLSNALQQRIEKEDKELFPLIET
ncbi:MAG: hemerythrin domain-containing protein [Deltaproteobacteria bacterium]|nr:hemerythrin domain-containing protein [Deltaproteobacteria bacterium]